MRQRETPPFHGGHRGSSPLGNANLFTQLFQTVILDAMKDARTKKKTSEIDVLSLKSVKAWETWLKVNHADTNGVWLCIQKKGSAEESPTYNEALDVALCYGW